MKFKVGDRIRATKSCSGSKAGNVYVAEYFEDVSSLSNLRLAGTDCNCEDGWELAENNTPSESKQTPIIKPLMKTISNAFKKFLSPELQAQVKAGFRDSNLELTQDGKDVLLELLASDKEKELTTKANEKIAEEEKQK
jgi:hypothetical protein